MDVPFFQCDARIKTELPVLYEKLTFMHGSCEQIRRTEEAIWVELALIDLIREIWIVGLTDDDKGGSGVFIDRNRISRVIKYCPTG